MDGPLLVDDEGLHGVVEKCGVKQLSSGVHVVYIEGFQAGGGVGMELKYSGPDTGGSKLLMRSGMLPSSNVGSGQYFKDCDPNSALGGSSSGFGLCIFRSEVELSRTPAFGDADTGKNHLYFVGKAQIPSVDVNDLSQFRKYIPLTPDANYAWAIYGQLLVGTAGSYTLCIISDDG